MLLDGLDYGTSDFLDLLKRKRPDLLMDLEVGAHTTSLPNHRDLKTLAVNTSVNDFLEGTTVLAAVYKDGVVIAGDRRAVEGFQIGERRIQKVYEVDTYSAIAIAGAAGPCIQMVKLFQVQVEFYEKVEGSIMSLEGKANFLSNMVRQNLPAALQGLIVIPIFAGYDIKRQHGKIFKYDPTGGRYEENDYYAIGSGGKDARSTLKKLYRPEMSRQEIVKIVAEALWDAADEDLGTGGPDLIREIYPNIMVIDQAGVSEVPNSEVKELYTELFERLRQ